jgi:hypothetical protein
MTFYCEECSTDIDDSKDHHVQITHSERKQDKNWAEVPMITKSPWYERPETVGVRPVMNTPAEEFKKSENMKDSKMEDVRIKANKTVRDARAIFTQISSTNLMNMPFYTTPQAKGLMRAAYEWLDDSVTKYQDEKYEKSIDSALTSIELVKRAYESAKKTIENSVI